MSISNLKIEIQKYEKLKIDINSIIKNLNNASNDLELVKPHLENNYSLNNELPKTIIRSLALAKNISETSNYLKNYVIPAIDSKIWELNKEIMELKKADIGGF